jgi:xanthine dehydrogenase FAD-binding subunit
MKYAIRDSLDISLIGCAVSVKTSKTGLIQDIRLSFGAAAGIPIRGYHAEHAVKGKMICDDTYKVFGKKALEDVSVISDKRASKEFRLHLCEILPQRTLEQAIIQTGNKR